MRTYRTPGVYFERQDAGLPPIGPIRTDVAALLGIAERGPVHTPVRIEALAQFQNVFGGKIPAGYLAYAAEGFFTNQGAACWVVRVADPDTAKTATLDLVDGGTRVLSLKAGSPGAWANRIYARWVLRAGEIISLTLHFPDGTEQLVRNPVEAALKKNDNLLDVERDTIPARIIAPLVELEHPDRASPSGNSVSIFALEGVFQGGADGLEFLQPRHFTGADAPEGVEWGLATLERIDEVSVLAIPDIMGKLRIVPQRKPAPRPACRDLNAPSPPPPLPSPPADFPPAFDDDQIYLIQQAMIAHCEKMRYRVAVLDTPDLIIPEAALALPRNFDSSFGAIYYPWILVDDPLRLTGVVRPIPPSGHVAGIYARTDLTRGVHKPPANAVLDGALDVRSAVDDVMHGELNDGRVNVLRAFAGRGIRVYGARTLSSDIIWRYVNVRRLLSMIEKAIDKGSQWIVFENNDARLRTEIDRVVRAYLESLFRAGMLDGASADDAYSVQCDGDTNPPQEADFGRVICRIGVQPPYPAEFVIVVIGKTQNSAEILLETGVFNA